MPEDKSFLPCEGGAGRLLPAPYLRAGLQHAAPHPSRAAWAGTRPCSFCVCVWMCACIQINCILILWGGVFFLLRFQSTFGRKAGVWATLIHSGSLLFLVSTFLITAFLLCGLESEKAHLTFLTFSRKALVCMSASAFLKGAWVGPVASLGRAVE